MRKILTYARLQAARMARYAPFVIAITLLICTCIGVALFALVENNDNSAENTKFAVAIVGEFEGDMLGLGIEAIKSMDSSQYTLDILELDEKTAAEKLRRREIIGYAVIPDGFVEAAMSGDVGHIDFVTNQSGIDLTTMFKQEILDMISRILVESQNGTYAMQDIILENKVDISKYMHHTNTLMASYVSMILSRSSALDCQVIGISDKLSFGGYMFSGLSVLLLLICGITCCPLFAGRDMALPRLLSANRISPLSQILSEYGAYLCLTILNMLPIVALLMLFSGGAAALIPELDGISTPDAVLIFVKFIPAVLAVTALQFLLYELTDSVVSGVLLQFVCAIGLSYISGCFYPISFFPKSIQVLSSVMPSGIARGYLSALISGAECGGELAALMAYTVILLGFAALTRHRRIKNA